jgi:hypothetical protein
MRWRHQWRVVVLMLAVAVLPSVAFAQADRPASPQPPQIDETVINVPTTLPLKAHHSYFRLTHRFARDLRRPGTTFGQLAEELFSLDSGAIIGLEYRFGLTSNLQAGVHRSILNKTIQTFGRWDAFGQEAGHPIGLSIGGSVEGTNNMQQDYQPSVSATLSRTHGQTLALYVSPAYVHHSHTTTLLELHEGHSHDTAGGEDADEQLDKRNTFFIGLGTRIRFLPSAFLVGEVSPRVTGYTPDRAAWNVGIEKLTHGHVLQLNFGNNFSTTPGMVARGGDKRALFMGFNLSRKF